MLQTQTRVPFDPSNRDHRLAVKTFLEKNSWAGTSISFTEDPYYISIAHQIQSKLLKWYLENENV